MNYKKIPLFLSGQGEGFWPKVGDLIAEFLSQSRLIRIVAYLLVRRFKHSTGVAAIAGSREENLACDYVIYYSL